MSDFGIELDDDLLNAALQAVEKTEKKKGRGTGETGDEDLDIEVEVDAAETAPPGDDDDLDFEVELDGDFDGDLDEDLDAAAARAAEQLDGAAPARDSARIATLEEELEQARATIAALKQDGRRMRGARRRLEDQVARAEAQVRDAKEARKTIEDQARGLRQQVRQLKNDIAAMRERRRKEREEDRGNELMRTVNSVLPVLDNLELALDHQTEEPARVVQGVHMILQQFHQVIAQLGVQRVVSGPGVLFDPEVHEAMSEVGTEELLPGSIVAELRSGYTLGGRLLRPSRVTVATPPGAEESDVNGPTGDGADGSGADGTANDGESAVDEDTTSDASEDEDTGAHTPARSDEDESPPSIPPEDGEPA